MNPVRPLSALLDLVRLMSPPIDLQQTLEIGLAHAVRLTGADAGWIRLAPESGRFHLAAVYACDDRYLERFYQICVDDADTGQTLDQAEPTVFPAETLSEELTSLNAAASAKWVLILSLNSDCVLHGVLCLNYTRKPDLSADLRDALRILGAVLSAAITSAVRIDALERESRTDALTGLGNRRHFEEEFRRELARARRAGCALSLAMIDVDQMKTINDRWGHVAGDQTLIAVAGLLADVRATDVVARYGGDEFIVLMPDTNLEQARAVMDRLHEAVERLNESQRLPVPIQLSIGVRQMVEMDRDLDLLARADAAMYREKRRQHPAPDHASDEDEVDYHEAR